MRENNKTIIGSCGLVCSQCDSFKDGQCKGCRHEATMSNNCEIMKCCMSRGHTTCAECTDFSDLSQCDKLNNFVQNVNRIREVGLESFIADNEN